MLSITGGHSHHHRFSVEEDNTYPLGLLGKLQALEEVTAVVSVSLVHEHYFQSTLPYEERGVFFLLLSCICRKS